MASIELASAYISLATSASEISREIGRAFAGADKIAADAGRDMGRSMAKTFEAAKPDVSKLAEDYERAQHKVRAASERSATLEENLARKVEIAQKKKVDAVEKYGAESSQALVAVDRLKLAEQKLEAASMAAASEQDKLTREVRDSGRALEEAQMAARDHGRELGRMDDALDDVKLAAKESARELTRTETAFNARPFVGEMGKVDREARTTARRAEDAFDDAGEQGGRKMGEGIRRGLTGIRDSFIGNFAADVAMRMFDGATDWIRGSTSLASDAEQSLGGVEAVFREHSKQIVDASEGAWDSVGLSVVDYQELATPLAAFLQNKGIADFADQTQGLLQLGADLAAQYGGPTSAAIEAITSLMRGEADPIERFGVSINEAAVQARMAQKGLTGLDGEALEHARTLTRIELLYEQTSRAQGAFAREATTDAGKGARAMAQFENAQTRLGESLMPYQTRFYEFLSNKIVPLLENKVIPFFEDRLIPAVDVLKDLFTGDWGDDLWAKLGVSEDDPRVQTLMSIRDGLDEIGDGLSNLGGGSFGKEISAGWRDDIQPALIGIREASREMWDVVGPILGELGAFFGEKMAEWGPETEANVGQVFDIIAGLLNLIQIRIERFTSVVAWIWDNWGTEIKAIGGALWDDQMRKFGGALDVIQGLIKIATGLMSGDWSTFAEGMKQTGSGMWTLLTSQFTLGQDLMRVVTTEITSFVGTKFDELRDRVANAFSVMADRVGDAWDRIKGLAAEPVNFVIREVYMGGLKPLVDGLTGLFGGDPLPAISEIETGRKTKKASGGVLPGYTPGRDVHTFWSPTAGTLMLSGGEAIMRPEWTRAVGGPGAVDRMNRQARGFAKGGVWPAPGVITSPYGFRIGPFNGAEIHDGIDIGAPLGTPVVAALPGIVTLAGWNGGYGNQVTIDHGGFTTFYAHLDSFSVAVGDLVKAGSLIGKVGSTGWSTGPHLHFGSSAGDPAALLSGDIPATAGAGASGFVSELLNLPGRIADIVDMLRGGDTSWARMIRGGVSGLVGKIGDWATEKLTSWLPTNDTPGQGGTFDGWWAEAIAIAGPEWEQYKEAVRTVAKFESGMNPLAVNDWDSNAIAGIPSKGLMQFIKPTFDRWAWPGFTNWLSPVHQILAFFRYVPGVYGSIWNHPGLKGLASGSGYRGYWRGTSGAAPGPAWVGERGPELVVSRQLRNMEGGEQVIPLTRFGAGAKPELHINVTAQGDDLESKLQEARWAARHDLSDAFAEVLANA